MRRSRGEPLTIELLKSWCEIDPVTGCWNWLKGKHPQGYGQLWYDGKSSQKAHRASYEIANGVKLPPEIDILHDCDNTSCINPEHLKSGDQEKNMRDAASRGRVHAQYTDSQIRDIRGKYVSYGHGALTRLTEEYNASPTQMHNIVKGKTYKHVR